jgi:hypothetical protein
MGIVIVMIYYGSVVRITSDRLNRREAYNKYFVRITGRVNLTYITS